jgi:large subunit ribosomal protein L9
MKVLFLENVVHVAKKGDIKEVKPGYAQNMLFPKKLAVELSEKVEKEMKNKVKLDESRRRWLIENRHNIAEELNHKKLEFKLKSDNSGKVFWSIWERDIIIEVKKLFKLELTKKHIDLPGGHIKKLGESEVFIKLGKDSMAKMFIIVEKENG